MTEMFTTLGTWNWLIFGFILMALEVAAPGIFLFWLGLAALLVGLLSFAFHPSWQTQLLMFAVFAAAARTGTAMEINGFPDRQDLPDELILRAKRHGVRFAIDTDSHSTVHLAHARYGIGLAQRAWLTTADVINAWPLAKLRAFVAAKRP